MATVYRHRRLDTFEIFYVGISSGVKEKQRPFHEKSRTEFWKNVVSKSKYEVEIIATNIQYIDALELEEFLISEYGRKDLGIGPLVNLTNGGERNSGYRHTKAAIDKISKSLKGVKKSKETIQKIKETKKRHCSTEEYKKSVSLLKSKPVIKCDLNGVPLKHYKSMIEAALDIGGLDSKISQVCKGSRKTHAGYIWKYS